MSVYKASSKGNSKVISSVNEHYKMMHRVMNETKQCECRNMTEEEKIKYGIKE